MPREKRRKVDKADDAGAAARGSSGSSSNGASSAGSAAWECEEKLRQGFFLAPSAGLRAVWELATSLSPDDPCGAFKPVGVTLCGPFDMLAGRRKRDDLPWFLHSRHRYDPPEVVTVASIDDGSHWAYHRDSPDEPPSRVVATVPDDGKRRRGRFKALPAPTLLDAIAAHGKKRVKSLKGGDRDAAAALVERVAEAAAAAAAADGSGAARAKRVPIDTTLSGLGVVVPYNEKTEVGWRPLSLTDAELQKYFESLLAAKEAGKEPDFATLDRLITFANIANDECDYGQALKLGLDLFTMVELDGDAKTLLATTYKLLNNAPFAEVVERHTASDRRRGDESSALLG